MCRFFIPNDVKFHSVKLIDIPQNGRYDRHSFWRGDQGGSNQPGNTSAYVYIYYIGNLNLLLVYRYLIFFCKYFSLCARAFLNTDSQLLPYKVNIVQSLFIHIEPLISHIILSVFAAGQIINEN